MKLIIDVKDQKVPFFMELINNLSFVKASPVSKEKALLIAEIEEAVNNVRLVKEGKMEAKSLHELLNEI